MKHDIEKLNSELDCFIDLIRECKSIDNASNITTRLNTIIQYAERLDKVDLKAAKPSFVDFVIEAVANERDNCE